MKKVKIIWSYAVLFLVNRLKTKAVVAPVRISKYRLVKSLDKVENSKRVSLGIYQFGGGKFMIKNWHGKIRDLTYYLLNHEYAASNLLVKKLIGEVRVAKPIEVINQTNLISFVYEFVEGKTLDQYSVEIQKVTLPKIATALGEIRNGKTHADHGDLTPDNIILSANLIYLIDLDNFNWRKNI